MKFYLFVCFSIFSVHVIACMACYNKNPDEEASIMKLYKQKSEYYATSKRSMQSIPKPAPCDFSKGNDNCKNQKELSK